MKICLAQTKSTKGDIEKNILNHLEWIEVAASKKADLIVFPELSLTGYEPNLAKKLAKSFNNQRLAVFQEVSDKYDILISVGLPIISNLGVLISMVVFQPKQQKITYAKQILHIDEFDYFTQGEKQIFFSIKNKIIVPAICYEALQATHNNKAAKIGADIYLTSVAKHQKGVDKALLYFPKVAKKHSMSVFMVNSVGYCSDFQSCGQSAVWNKNGTLIGKLNKNEGLLFFDTDTENLIQIYKRLSNE